jgi:hypothetical protein
MRSTSPPKSAWPGVSTMLMRVPCHSTEVALARMVIPAFAFEVVRIHGALGHLLVLAEGAALLQQAIDQRGLAMVDVRDDRDVADVHNDLSGGVDWARLYARSVTAARQHPGACCRWRAALPQSRHA